MSWYKSLSYTPTDNLSNILYGCCDLSSLYEGLGAEAGYVRFKAKENGVAAYYICSKLQDILPSFQVNAPHSTDVSGTYKAALGGVSVFWTRSDADNEIVDLPRIEVDGSSITLYANEVDSWRGTFPSPGTSASLIYSGERLSECVTHYGWETITLFCRWDVDSFYRESSSSGRYECAGTSAYHIFGSPAWTFGDKQCIMVNSSTCIDKDEQTAVLQKIIENGTSVWVYGDRGSASGWWESATLNQDLIGAETVFKFHALDNTVESEADVVFVFSGYVEFTLTAPILLSEVALWR